MTIAFGVLLPALTFALAGAPDDGPAGVELSDVQVEGRELFATNCATCHTLDDANAVGRVGPDLDRLRPDASLTLDAIKNGRARGWARCRRCCSRARTPARWPSTSRPSPAVPGNHNCAHLQGPQPLLRSPPFIAESPPWAGSGDPIVGASRLLGGVAQLFQREPVS